MTYINRNVLDQVKTIPKESILSFYDKFISPVSKTTRKLSIHLENDISAQQQLSSASVVNDLQNLHVDNEEQDIIIHEDYVSQWKQRLELGPGAYPVKDIEFFKIEK